SSPCLRRLQLSLRPPRERAPKPQQPSEFHASISCPEHIEPRLVTAPKSPVLPAGAGSTKGALLMASPSPAARALFAFHHRAVHVPRVERVTRALVAQIGRAASLLDIGCGDGTVAQGIGAAIGAARVAGVDVLVRPETAIPVTAYDGEQLPFRDGAFEAVVISDVLHHCERPAVVLREALRVASRVVAIKDHFRFDRVSGAILLAMDQVGNAAPGVLVRGTYFTA